MPVPCCLPPKRDFLEAEWVDRICSIQGPSSVQVDLLHHLLAVTFTVNLPLTQRHPDSGRPPTNSGTTKAATLVASAVAAIACTVVLEVWNTVSNCNKTFWCECGLLQLYKRQMNEPLFFHASLAPMVLYVPHGPHGPLCTSLAPMVLYIPHWPTWSSTYLTGPHGPLCTSLAPMVLYVPHWPPWSSTYLTGHHGPLHTSLATMVLYVSHWPPWSSTYLTGPHGPLRTSLAHMVLYVPHCSHTL